MPIDPSLTPLLRINHAEEFPHLESPPIVEAVIQINTRVLSPWVEGEIAKQFSPLQADYPKVQTLNATRLTVQMQDPVQAARAGQPIADLPLGAQLDPVPIPRNLEADWVGLRLTSSDGKLIAVFTRDSFALSRLAPYGKWSDLCSEFERLWNLYSKIGEVQEVTRISSRYINRLEVSTDDLDLGQYFRGFGTAPTGFGLAGFLHQDVVAIPNTAYQVNLIRTHQLALEDGAKLPLILDLDAFSTEQTSRERANISEKLADLRWVKNRVFFSAITERFMEMCK